jgi:flagellar biosynthesis protein FlhA
MAEIAINNAAAAAAPWSGLLRMLQRGVGAPLLLLAVLAMVVLPLPPLALDVLFTFNIALSVLVVMAVVNIARPLDFGIFPTVLLLATRSGGREFDDFAYRSY